MGNDCRCCLLAVLCVVMAVWGQGVSGESSSTVADPDNSTSAGVELKDTTGAPYNGSSTFTNTTTTEASEAEDQTLPSSDTSPFNDTLTAEGTSPGPQSQDGGVSTGNDTAQMSIDHPSQNVSGEATAFGDPAASEEDPPAEDPPTHVPTDGAPTGGYLDGTEGYPSEVAANFTYTNDTLPVDRPRDDTPFDEDIPTEEHTPTEDTPFGEIPTDEDAPTEEDTPFEDIPTEEHTPTEDTPFGEIPTDEDAPTEEDTPFEDIPTEEHTPPEDTPFGEIPTDEDAPTKEDTPFEDIPTEEDTPPEDTPFGEIPTDEDAPTEEDTPFDNIPTEGSHPEDTFGANSTAEDWHFDDIPAEGTPLDGYAPAGNDTASESDTAPTSNLGLAPTAANVTETMDDNIDGDMSNVTVVNATDMTNVTAVHGTDVDDVDDADAWEDEDWNYEDDVTDEYDTANVTAEEDVTANQGNTSFTDTDVTNETTPAYVDDDDEYDDEYDYEYEDVSEDQDMTSENDTDVSMVDDVSVPDVVTSSNDTSDDATPVGDVSVDDVTSTNDTAESTPPVLERADFVVYDNSGNPCLLASLNITIHLKYHVQEGLVRETYDTVSKKNTQDGSTYQGTCDDTLSRLSISWNNDTFTLNFTFILQNKSEAQPNEIDMDVVPAGANASSQTWSLQQVSLSYDTANENMFPGAYNPAVERVATEHLNLFRTPLGMSYVCRTPEAVTVEFRDVDLTFNFVHLMPFQVQSQFFSNDTVQCSRDMSTGPTKEESYTVPLIVAAVLASIVLAILIVYGTVRCVARRMRQADYKQME
ncbi:uncharacterized protein LOC143281508 [Babylonia areolata]|uniref:uncharacterized protein LOC143281508 n=1 Tax=Babylonia areolata TaxID=304850 RepID=UPI003FCF62FB